MSFTPTKGVLETTGGDVLYHSITMQSEYKMKPRTKYTLYNPD